MNCYKLLSFSKISMFFLQLQNPKSPKGQKGVPTDIAGFQHDDPGISHRLRGRELDGHVVLRGVPQDHWEVREAIGSAYS